MATRYEDVVINVISNTTQSSEKLQALYKKLTDLRNAEHVANEKGDDKRRQKIEAEIRTTERGIREINSRTEQVANTLKNLDAATPKELRRTIKDIQAALNSGSVERGSEEWQGLVSELAAAKQELKQVQSEWKLVSSTMEESSTLPQRISGAMQGLFNSFSGIGEKLRTAASSLFLVDQVKGVTEQYVQSYAQIEQAYVDVTKYTGLTREEVLSLNEAFKRMDTATPRQRLNELAADAGRLGLQSKQDVLDFVEAANALNVALGEDLGQDAVKQIGKLADVFGDTQRLGLKQAMLSTGSAINELAQNSSAAEGYLVDFASRLGGIASQSGLTQAQVLGLGAAMDSAAIGAEISSTAISKILQKLYTNTGDFAARAGLNVEEFARLLRTDANEALLQFAEALQKKGGIADLAPMFADMHISGAGIAQTLQTLAARSADVRTQQERATAAFQEGTSVLKEYDAQNNTVAGQLARQRERLEDVRREIGEALLPAYSSASATGLVFARIIATLVTTVARFSSVIIPAITAIGAYKAAVATASALIKAFIVVKGLYTAATRATTAALQAEAVAQAEANMLAAANPYTMIAAAVAAVGMAIWGTVEAKNALNETTEEETKKQNEAAEAAEKERAAQEELSKIENSLNDAREEGIRKKGEEIVTVNELARAVNDETLSKEQNATAAEKLRRLAPKLADSIKLQGDRFRVDKAAVDKYTQSLQRMAIAQAAADKFKEIGATLLTSKMEEKALFERAKGFENALRALRSDPRFELAYKNTNLGIVPDPDQAKDLAARYGGSADLWRLENYNAFRARVQELATSLGSINKQLSVTRQTIASIPRVQQQLTEAITDAGYTLADLIDTGMQAVGGDADTGSAGTSGSAGASPASGGGKTGKTKGKHGGGRPTTANKEEADARRAAAEKLQADLVRIEADGRKAEQAVIDAYTRGETATYEEMQRALYDAQRRTIEQRRDLYDEGTKERAAQEAALTKLAQTEARRRTEVEVKEINEAAQLADRALQNRAIRENWSDDKLLEQQQEAERARLEAVVKAWEKIEHADATAAQKLSEARAALQQHNAQTEQETETRRLQRFQQLRQQYTQRSARQQFQDEMKILEQMHGLKLIEEEEYLKLRAALINRYLGVGGEIEVEATERVNKLIEKARARAAKGRAGQAGDAGASPASGNAVATTATGWGSVVGQIASPVNSIVTTADAIRELQRMREADLEHEADYIEAEKRLRQQQTQNIVNAAAAGFSAMQEFSQSISSFYDAQMQLELAQIEQRFTREEQAAQGNSTRLKQIEARKQAEQAKIKNKYNKKRQKMEIAQAVASTAANVINAFGSQFLKAQPWTLALAIAAATLAAAQGAVQIATIKKQHEAEAAGYMQGGFTAAGPRRKAVGVVHAGEFVATQEAVRNPQLLPALQLLDRAQRGGYVADLSALDLAAAAYAAAPAAAIRTAALTGYAGVPPATKDTPSAAAPAGNLAADLRETITALRNRLDEPIRAEVLIDGQDGLARKWAQWQRYQRQ